MTPRSVCIVPGCANSSAKFAGHRYICGPHWRLVAKPLKAEHRRLSRAWVHCAHGDRKAARQAFYLHWYDVLEPAAIEAAAGLS